MKAKPTLLVSRIVVWRKSTRCPSPSSSHPVEHLAEELVHIGMGLLDLGQQHDTIGPAANGFREHADLPVSDAARRRAPKHRHAVRLLELAHVQGNEGLLAAVHRLGQGQRRFGLADTGRPGQQEHAGGLARIRESRVRRLDAPRDDVERTRLPEHAPLEHLSKLKHGQGLVGEQPSGGDTGPLGDDLCNHRFVDLKEDLRSVLLKALKLLLEHR